jgi:hypothetical protein
MYTGLSIPALAVLASNVALSSAYPDVNGFSYIGCESSIGLYSSKYDLLLHTEPVDMTIESCTQACKDVGARFAAIDFV